MLRVADFETQNARLVSQISTMEKESDQQLKKYKTALEKANNQVRAEKEVKKALRTKLEGEKVG